MNNLGVELSILLFLILVNGVFAMAEIAIVSARRSRLRGLASEGDGKARAALELAESPNHFLSTVQVGITLVGILAGAFGGAALSEEAAALLVRAGLDGEISLRLGFWLVVVGITYLSLVLGELVPKRIGLMHAESIARWSAIPLQQLARGVGPLVRFLGASTDALLKIFGLRGRPESVVSEEEVRMLMQEGVRAGAFNQVESQLVHSALEIDQLPVREIMTPRPKVIWLSQDEPHEQLWHKIVISGHSEFPVYHDSREHLVGVVTVKALYAHLAAGVPVRIKDLMTPPLVVPAAATVLQLVESFKKAGKTFAMVADEFGVLVGMVTLKDVMEALLGEFPSQGERAKPSIQRRADGSMLVDAMIEPDALERELPGFRFDPIRRADHQTVAGLLIRYFAQIPREGETVEIHGYLFEVLDMDRHRIDKILVIPLPSKQVPGPVSDVLT